MFFFDNESFRFLVTLKNKIQYSDIDKKTFEVSWEKSVETVEIMMEYIMRLPVHYVKSTIAVNAARNITMQLARPMAEFTRSIQSNIQFIEDKILEINSTEKSL